MYYETNEKAQWRDKRNGTAEIVTIFKYVAFIYNVGGGFRMKWYERVKGDESDDQ